MAADHLQTFTDGNFEESVIKAGELVLVDFWAEWCGPCKRLAPTVDALAADYAGKVTVGKLNVDDNPNTALKFQIRGIPALLLFKDGQVVESVVGMAPKEDLKKAIDKHILGDHKLRELQGLQELRKRPEGPLSRPFFPFYNSCNSTILQLARISHLTLLTFHI